MSKEQEELLAEAYENYQNYFLGYDDIPNKELFILACKTDTKLAERWGLKIEERELSLEERKQIVKNKYFQEFYWKIVDDDNDVVTIFEMDKRNIPTKLITITYNDKTIESYE
jgi:hypothetical protein